MKKKSYVWATALLVLAGLCVAGMLLSAPDEAEAQTALPNCPTGLATNITSGATLTGITPINLGVPTSTTSFTIDKVIYLLDGKPIGQARRNTTNTNYWTMPWPTQLAPLGVHQLQAHVFYNQSAQCVTPLLPVNIANTTASGVFGIDLLPPTWSGVTNSVIDIMVNPSSNTGLPNAELNQYVVYQWETNIGNLTPALGMARFSSGATAGTGRVKVRAYYGGREAEREMPVVVQSQVTTPTGGTTSSGTGSVVDSGTNTTTTAPTGTAPSSTSTTTPLQTTPLTPEQKIQLIATQIESQPAILSCATQNLSAARIEDLKLTGRRLLPEEFARMRTCFSQTSYVVPSSYAPTAPDEVKEKLEQISTARIKDMKTEVIPTAEGEQRNVLRLEGQAEPNSDVLLYVFSEPLVLYAKADENGNWVYDLVDPMEPGDHEAYAVVEASDGTYKRSSAFSFLIETAQASSENPNGYSLAVQTVGTLNPPASKGRISLYMIGSGIIVLIVLAVGGYIVTKTLRHIPDDNQGGGHGYGG